MNDYDIKKAAEKLLWRFNSKKGFTPNENDKSSLNTLLNWINKEKENRLKDNLKFAKLFIYVFNQNIRHYQTDVLDKEPQKELSRLLNIPIEIYYERFYEEIRTVQLKKMINRVKKENGNFTKQELEDYFDKDFVKEQLNHMITEALNRF